MKSARRPTTQRHMHRLKRMKPRLAEARCKWNANLCHCPQVNVHFNESSCAAEFAGMAFSKLLGIIWCGLNVHWGNGWWPILLYCEYCVANGLSLGIYIKTYCPSHSRLHVVKWPHILHHCDCINAVAAGNAINDEIEYDSITTTPWHMHIYLPI